MAQAWTLQIIGLSFTIAARLRFDSPPYATTCIITDAPPALSPSIVTLSGSPPKAAICLCIHSSAARWSSSPAFRSPSLATSDPPRKPRMPRRVPLGILSPYNSTCLVICSERTSPTPLTKPPPYCKRSFALEEAFVGFHMLILRQSMAKHQHSVGICFVHKDIPSEPTPTTAGLCKHGGPQLLASVTVCAVVLSSNSCGALNRRFLRGGWAYGAPPKNVTGPFDTPAGDVAFPANAAYPTSTTGPRLEERAA